MKKHCIDLHAHLVPDSFRKAMEELEIDSIEEDSRFRNGVQKIISHL